MSPQASDLTSIPSRLLASARGKGGGAKQESAFSFHVSVDEESDRRFFLCVVPHNSFSSLPNLIDADQRCHDCFDA